MNKKHSVIAKTAGVGMLGLSLALCGLSAPLAPQAQSATTSLGATTAYADTLNLRHLPTVNTLLRLPRFMRLMETSLQ